MTALPEAQVVVVGAGIAGIASAHALAVKHQLQDVVIVDPSPPMTEASGKSMECYRTWVPDDVMRPLLKRSVTLMKEAIDKQAWGNVHENGYLLVAPDAGALAGLEAEARRIDAMDSARSGLTQGRARTRDVEVIRSSKRLADTYPYLREDVAGALHLKEAGWIDAQQFGLQLFEQSRQAGVNLVNSSVESLVMAGDRVGGVRLATGEAIRSDVVVNAAGIGAELLARSIGSQHGLTEVSSYKVAFRDPREALPRDTPVLVWAGTNRIDWDDDEIAGLREIGRTDLLGELAPFCHCRPEGGPDSDHVLGAWMYGDAASANESDPLFAEIVIRGLSRMLPSLSTYRDALPEGTVDGARYTSTSAGLPLAGPSHIPGLYVIAGLGGSGIALSMGLAELVAGAITDSPGPEYPTELSPTRASPI